MPEVNIKLSKAIKRKFIYNSPKGPKYIKSQHIQTEERKQTRDAGNAIQKGNAGMRH